MSTQTSPTYMTIQKGIRSLLKTMGPKGTREFLRFFYAGKGDSVKDFQQMWDGMSVQDIHQDIMKAKIKKEI